MLYVVATRIRETVPSALHALSGGGLGSTLCLRRTHTEISGIALRAPSVGQGWVVYCDGASRRVVTSPVQRVLRVAEGQEMYIETVNSVYRLEMFKPEAAPKDRVHRSRQA